MREEKEHELCSSSSLESNRRVGVKREVEDFGSRGDLLPCEVGFRVQGFLSFAI